jgi:hypothetical protein
MPRKKLQKPELEATELPVELPLEVVETEPKVVSPIRRQVRPVPDTEWGELVTEMRDYVTTHHDFINSSLEKHNEVAAKLVAEKKPTRSSALSRPSVILRDDMPAPAAPPAETDKSEAFPRNRRIKPKS